MGVKPEPGMMYGKSGERMFQFLLALGPGPVSLRALRTGEHPLSRFYRRVTDKTLARDIKFLKQRELILVEGEQTDYSSENDYGARTDGRILRSQ